MTAPIKVSKLPVDPGPAAWNDVLPEQDRYPELSDDLTYDYVVVGGGFAGLSAARRLSMLAPSARIALLEATRLAEGPAGRNSGFMIDLPHELNSESYAGALDSDLRQIRLNRAAIDFAEEAAHELGMSEQVFARTGKLTASASPRGEHHLTRYKQHLAAMGEHAIDRSADEMRALTGTEFYTGGLFTEGAAMIQPAEYIRSLAKGVSANVDIYEQSPALEIDRSRGITVKTPKGRLRTGSLILAVNGHAQSFGFFPRQFLHVFTYASMTRALTVDEVNRLGGEHHWGILPADPMGTTVRRDADYRGSGDRIVVRNHATLNQSIEASASDMRRAAKLQDQAFKRRFPMLNNIDMEYRWGGRLCLSLNSMPAFGELEPGIWSACCQNGLGTVKGTLSGMMAADAAVQGDSELLREFKVHEAPKKLPMEPFLSVGANATMRWKEWQAGIEL